MVLQVAFEDFATTVRRVIGDGGEAYVCSQDGRSLVTASAPGESAVIATVVKLSQDETAAELQKAGLRVFRGRWADDVSLEHEAVTASDLFVAAVSYKTEGGTPGVWVDAFPAAPTQVQVLRAMYDEMIENGEMVHVPFEEFVRMSNASVVVVSPTDLRSFASKHGT